MIALKNRILNLLWLSKWVLWMLIDYFLVLFNLLCFRSCFHHFNSIQENKHFFDKDSFLSLEWSVTNGDNLLSFNLLNQLTKLDPRMS